MGPKRYRLIDPALDVPRTLCYVEIPEDSTLDATAFLGQTVGIRAREKYLQTGDVDPVVIVVAEDIVLLNHAVPFDKPIELGNDAVEPVQVSQATVPQSVMQTTPQAGMQSVTHPNEMHEGSIASSRTAQAGPAPSGATPTTTAQTNAPESAVSGEPEILTMVEVDTPQDGE